MALETQSWFQPTSLGREGGTMVNLGVFSIVTYGYQTSFESCQQDFPKSLREMLPLVD